MASQPARLLSSGQGLITLLKRQNQQMVQIRDGIWAVAMTQGFLFIFFFYSQDRVSESFRNKPTVPVLMDSALAHVQHLLFEMCIYRLLLRTAAFVDPWASGLPPGAGRLQLLAASVSLLPGHRLPGADVPSRQGRDSGPSRVGEREYWALVNESHKSEKK